MMFSLRGKRGGVSGRSRSISKTSDHAYLSQRHIAQSSHGGERRSTEPNGDCHSLLHEGSEWKSRPVVQIDRYRIQDKHIPLRANHVLQIWFSSFFAQWPDSLNWMEEGPLSSGEGLTPSLNENAATCKKALSPFSHRIPVRSLARWRVCLMPWGWGDSSF